MRAHYGIYNVFVASQPLQSLGLIGVGLKSCLLFPTLQACTYGVLGLCPKVAPLPKSLSPKGALSKGRQAPLLQTPGCNTRTRRWMKFFILARRLNQWLEHCLETRVREILRDARIGTPSGPGVC